jgi:spermidine/putrescine ABC transporter ATP-binding subunit
MDGGSAQAAEVAIAGQRPIAVELAAVSKHFAGVRAVDEVSLEIAQGEFATILGPSGSGKTTILSLIAGIVPPTAGRIVIGGRDVTSMPAAQRNVGLVFQSYALFPHMTVFDNVAFPLSIRRVARGEIEQRVEEALRLVRLSDYNRRRPSQLSGGQQQRVALARAVVFKPDILLLDEPLAALDRKLREEVRLEIRHLQRSLGITTVLVTHDQDEALSLSDRIVVLQHGKVQQIDSPERIYREPRNRFVADFLGIANFLDGEVVQQDGDFRIVLGTGEAVPCGVPAPGLGRTVCGVLRPEQIVIDAAADGAGLVGRVAEAIFFGDSVRYVVTLESGRSLIVHAGETRINHPEGAIVSLRWDPSAVWVLPGGGDTAPARRKRGTMGEEA